MKFLSNVLATLVGLFVFFMVSFFGLLVIGALFSSSEDTVSVKDNSVIELDLSEIKYDYAGKVNFKDFDYTVADHNGLSDVLKAIDHAKRNNSNIKKSF